MTDRELLRLHVEAVWGITLSPIDAAVGDVVVAAGAPPWSLYLATLADGSQVTIWRADTPAERRAGLLALAHAAGVHWDEAHAMRREVVFAAPESAPHVNGQRARELGAADAALVEAFASGSATYFLSPRTAPCVGVVVDGRLVSVAHSSRQTAEAYELGVDTALDARRRGYAADAVTLWTQLVQKHGLTPIYSAFAWNDASLRLAQSVGFTRRIESVYGPVPRPKD